MIGVIGRKLGMTQLFNEQGQQIPCTVVEATPNPRHKVTTKESAGFASVELGYGAQRVARPNGKGERTPKGRRANKAEVGHARRRASRPRRDAAQLPARRCAGQEPGDAVVHGG
jgi:large subunit ribosomal protein L3